MPQTSMEVIKGQMVVLRATYSLPGATDPSDSTVIWNFWTNNTQLVRTKSELIVRLLGSKNVNLAELFLSSTLKALKKWRLLFCFQGLHSFMRLFCITSKIVAEVNLEKKCHGTAYLESSLVFCFLLVCLLFTAHVVQMEALGNNQT